MTTKKIVYNEGVGRRKTATARVRLAPAKTTSITINGKTLSDYFQHFSLQRAVSSVLETDGVGKSGYNVTVRVLGGGLTAQAGATRLGIARALVHEQSERRTQLKKLGYLKRDARAVERKKFGLRKARRRPQWSKR
jgi:small subunit ribosomal protein S9